MVTTLEYKLEEKDSDRLYEIVGSIKGLRTLFDFLGLLTIPEDKKTRGYAKYGGVFIPGVKLIHLLAKPRTNISAFLFDAHNQSCADYYTDRVIGYYDGRQEESDFKKFRYGCNAGGTYQNPKSIAPIKELENIRRGPQKTIRVTYLTGGYWEEKVKETIIFKR